MVTINVIIMLLTVNNGFFVPSQKRQNECIAVDSSRNTQGDTHRCYMRIGFRRINTPCVKMEGFRTRWNAQGQQNYKQSLCGSTG